MYSYAVYSSQLDATGVERMELSKTAAIAALCILSQVLLGAGQPGELDMLLTYVLLAGYVVNISY